MAAVDRQRLIQTGNRGANVARRSLLRGALEERRHGASLRCRLWWARKRLWVAYGLRSRERVQQRKYLRPYERFSLQTTAIPLREGRCSADDREHVRARRRRCVSADDVVLTTLGNYQAEKVSIIHENCNDEATYLEEGEGM